MTAAHRAHCLDTAKEYVTKDRNSAYGDPEDNFRDIAYLQRLTDQCSDPVAKVALGAIAIKIARLVRNPTHGDSWIDIAGYAACGYDGTVGARATSEPNVYTPQTATEVMKNWSGPSGLKRPQRMGMPVDPGPVTEWDVA